MAENRKRIEMLDLLRGAAMLLVIFYHIVYDLRFIYGLKIPRTITPGQPELEAVHTGFLWVLFAVSGICSRYSKAPLKRGAVLYIIGFLITLFTSLFMPSMLIVFGVLSCFGACMVIVSLIKPLLEKIPWAVLFAVSVILWIIFMDFHKGEINLIFTTLTLPPLENAAYLYPLGLKSSSFSSADYFPLIPYIFMFTAGFALFKPINEHKLPNGFYEVKSGVLGFIGRHSLIIYALHQPILIILFELIF